MGDRGKTLKVARFYSRRKEYFQFLVGLAISIRVMKVDSRDDWASRRVVRLGSAMARSCRILRMVTFSMGVG
jgi:hypothetical protein